MAIELAPLKQEMPPPGIRYTPLAWMRRNLFSTWYNTLLTIFILYLAYAIVKPSIVWLVEEANWEVVRVNFRLLMAGQYPADQLWRAWLCLHLLASIIGLSWGVWVRGRKVLGGLLVLSPLALALLPWISSSIRVNLVILAAIALISFVIGRKGGLALRRAAVFGWVLYFPLILFLISGFGAEEGFMRVVPSSLWGGLMLTFMLTVVGISFSFPLGVLLALGRRSSQPVMRAVSVAYIEIIRGVPLVTILFMTQTMVPFFLPSGITIDRVLRAMVGIIMFSAAYLAENVRGGLQAIPVGQYEAAYALGLKNFQTMFLIILPQALRLVIPVLMGLFISLFKDTSLVATVGLLELLGISRSILAQPLYVSYQREVLLFITLLYWVFCYLMSYVSRRLEISLGVGER